MSAQTFIPVNHVILFLLFVRITFPCILVKVLLLSLSFYRQVMAEFAFPPLFANPLLIINAQHRFRIHPERNLLRLNRLEKCSSFSPGSFVRSLFFLALSLFSIFLLLLGRFGGGSLRLQSLYLFLGLTAFFLRRNCLALISLRRKSGRL